MSTVPTRTVYQQPLQLLRETLLSNRRNLSRRRSLLFPPPITSARVWPARLSHAPARWLAALKRERGLWRPRWPRGGSGELTGRGARLVPRLKDGLHMHSLILVLQGGVTPTCCMYFHPRARDQGQGLDQVDLDLLTSLKIVRHQVQPFQRSTALPRLRILTISTRRT